MAYIVVRDGGARDAKRGWAEFGDGNGHLLRHIGYYNQREFTATPPR